MRPSGLGRAALRGVGAAMAMSVIRSVTTRLGLVRMTPPEEISAHGAAPVFARIPPDGRPAARELAHWSYGAAGGVIFLLLPAPVRARRITGPLFGILVWALFEAVFAPILGNPDRERPTAERAALVADHLLYGAIVGSDV